VTTNDVPTTASVTTSDVPTLPTTRSYELVGSQENDWDQNLGGILRHIRLATSAASPTERVTLCGIATFYALYVYTYQLVI